MIKTYTVSSRVTYTDSAHPDTGAIFVCIRHPTD